MSCKFCDLLNLMKRLEENHNDLEYLIEYKAALISESYYKKQFSGQSTHDSYDLNYCPECGKEIKNK